MTKKTILIAIIFDSIIVISIITGILYWSDQRDQKLMAAMEQYEEYIQDEYGMSVYEYREFIKELNNK